MKKTAGQLREVETNIKAIEEVKKHRAYPHTWVDTIEAIFLRSKDEV